SSLRRPSPRSSPFHTTTPTQTYTLSLHDALPISRTQGPQRRPRQEVRIADDHQGRRHRGEGNRPQGSAREHGRADGPRGGEQDRSEEHTSELQSQSNLVCRLLLEKKKQKIRMQMF